MGVGVLLCCTRLVLGATAGFVLVVFGPSIAWDSQYEQSQWNPFIFGKVVISCILST